MKLLLDESLSLVREAMGNIGNERILSALSALLCGANAMEAALADPATGVVVLR